MIAALPNIPCLYIFLCLTTASRAVTLCSPLIADYVHYKSLGVAFSLNYFGITSGGILSTTVLYWIDFKFLKDNIGYPFYMCGGWIILVAVWLIFGLQETKPQITEKTSICKGLKVGAKEVCKKRSLIIAVLSYSIGAVINIIQPQFCTLLIKDIYTYDKKSMTLVEKRLSLLFLISTMIAFPVILLFGSLADKFKT